MTTTFIYALEDPRDGAVRYIGKSDDPAYRLKKHLRREQTRKSYWVQSLVTAGMSPRMVIIDEVPSSDWQFWEQHWIQVMKGWGFDLTNGDAGGIGHGRITTELKAKISRTLRGRPNTRLAKLTFAYNASDGAFAAEYSSGAEAAAAVNGDRPNIVRALRQRSIAYGFFWSYEKTDVFHSTNYVNGRYQATEKHRQSISASGKGKQLGRVFSLETKEKMSASAKSRWAYHRKEPLSLEIE